MSIALGVYNRLPASSRSIAASMRGYYLKWWRYGKDTDRLVEEALERDVWDKKAWTQWQEERLSYVLHRAATRVPYYQQLWAQRRRRGDRSSWEYLENWPVLEKQVVRSNSRALIADDCDISRLFHDHTSGTTGTPLDIWLSLRTVREWYALFEARCRRWYGFTRHDRWAMIGGQLITPVSQTKPPFWVWNAGLNQLYLSSYHLSPELIPFYLKALVKYRVRYLLGYPSALYALALSASKLGLKEFGIETVITNAEPLYEYQSHAIREAFGCPVRETYGMAEIVTAGSDCENGRLHAWPEVGITEDTGENENLRYLICTGILNIDMPLIRYRVGDSGTFSPDECSCGRYLPLFEHIDGRSDDLLYTADGRSIGRLDPVFKSGARIEEAQIIQLRLKKVRILYVPAEGCDESDLRSLSSRLRERMGDVEILFEKVVRIPRSDRGKFRAVICELPFELRRELKKNEQRCHRAQR